MKGRENLINEVARNSGLNCTKILETRSIKFIILT